ncbi:MAG: ABC transporter permease [Erysipelotrichaceae bacterium]|nr:ABC transporter permease [Erysipelotrichaceae bacterium]
MKRYILGRLLRSIISIFIVVSIAIVMIYTLVPKENIFFGDNYLSKLGSKPDEMIQYKHTKWEALGYLDYLEQSTMCKNSEDYSACMIIGSQESMQLKEDYEARGYTVERFPKSGFLYAYRDYTALELIYNWFTNLIVIDHVNKVEDVDNSDLDRKIYIAKDFNGVPAIKCSGCENEYLVYFNGQFPFIHQNLISLNFGISYPTYNGIPTMEVISAGQGSYEYNEVTLPSGTTANTPMDLHSCTYKPTSTLDRLDREKFTSNYADCQLNYTDPSMISTSYMFGILALIVSYVIGLPGGIFMARHKGKTADKIGTVYINIMIAVPSLAFIYFVKLIGTFFGLPDKFPQFGFGNILSYILPVLILGLLSTASLMIWTRRYMVDQSNSDYVKFARAKGLSQKEIFNNHILKNAIIPIVNGIPASIILAISGAVITETVFAIPGMGKMLPDAIKSFNNSMVITLTFILTALSVLSLLLGDILITFVDPRIKLDNKGDSR